MMSIPTRPYVSILTDSPKSVQHHAEVRNDNTGPVSILTDSPKSVQF